MKLNCCNKTNENHAFDVEADNTQLNQRITQINL